MVFYKEEMHWSSVLMKSYHSTAMNKKIENHVDRLSLTDSALGSHVRPDLPTPDKHNKYQRDLLSPSTSPQPHRQQFKP